MKALKTREFPDIIFTEGPTGRWAAVRDGLDVWEIIEPYYRTRAAAPSLAKWQRLYFLPLPHKHGALRAGFPDGADPAV